MRQDWQRIYFSFVVLAVMVAVPGNGFARDQQELTIDGLLNTMNRSLKLTEGQQKEITSVLRDYTQQVMSLKAEGGSAAAQQEKFKFLRDQMDVDLAHYLTEEQLVLWKRQRLQAEEKGSLPPKSDHLSSDGNKKNIAVGEHQPQKDSGVLESADPDKIKTSGIW